ncbi:hypothetical protein QE436_000834 [Pantoea anthophila]|nr:hypothetical protein [Pantoea anthophila]
MNIFRRSLDRLIFLFVPHSSYFPSLEDERV